MIRRSCIGILIALLSPLAYLSAAPIFFSGLPAGYTPGSPLTFTVGLPPITNLGSYNIDLVLSGSTGVAGVDYSFDLAATAPVASQYVFPPATNYFDAVNVDAPNLLRLTLSDFAFSGVNVVTGINDLVADVVINTAANYAGVLTLSIGTDGLILDTPDLVPTPVAGFDGIKSDTQAAGPIILPAVPEPAGITLISAMVTLQMIRRWPGRLHRTAT